MTTNYLIDASITSDYYDERVIGGKTGFTTPAGRCVMCVAESGNLRYLCCPGGQQYRGGRVYVFLAALCRRPRPWILL